jgi:hypothetical protein
MKTMTEKSFDTVKFFRAVKEIIANELSTMTLDEQKEYLKKIREGKIRPA